MLAPIIPATASAKTRPGKESIISAIRMIILSIIPPKYPEMTPKIVPIKKINATTPNVAVKEEREP